MTSCRVGESSCQAKCICHSGSSCSLSSAELGKQQARVQLAVSLQSVMSSEDVTSDNVVGWVSSLSALTQQPDEISPSLATDTLTIAANILSGVQSSGVSYESALPLLDLR